MNTKALLSLVVIAALSGCSPQMAAMEPAMTSPGANLLFEQERPQQQAALQRQQEHLQRQRLYLNDLRCENQP